MKEQERREVAPRKLLIAGAGGLGTEYVWVAEEMNHAAMGAGGGKAVWEILGFTDDAPHKKNTTIAGYLVHGTIQETFAKFGRDGIGFAAAIGVNTIRKRVAHAAEALGWAPQTLVHPSVIVAADARIEAGSYLAPGVVVCPGARVGMHVIINTHVSVGHDSTLGDFVQVCPGARVSGGCRVEQCGFLGSNATLAPRTVVGEGAVVGANSLVIREVAPGITVLGCPALAVGKTRG
jgi:sugar O-acyltransferase (sialic acid O-acetyltransferase NeuD family)